MQEWVAIVISLAVCTVVIVTALVKLQSALFDKMHAMMKEVITNHSKDSEAHSDIRDGIKSQKIQLAHFEKEQDARWEKHDKWSQEAVRDILAEIRNHKA